jgi:hypothetical protein
MTSAAMEHLEVLVEAPGGIDQLKRMVVELAVSGQLLPRHWWRRPSAADAADAPGPSIGARCRGARGHVSAPSVHTTVCRRFLHPWR